MPIVGGITTFVRNLQSELTSRGLTVFTITNMGESAKDVVVVKGKGFAYTLRAYLSLRQFRPDIIHCQAHWYTLLPAVLYKLVNRKTKIIFTFHTDLPEDLINVKKSIFGYLLTKCDSVSFVSMSLKDEISKKLKFNTNLVVIYPGVLFSDAKTIDIADFIKKYSLDNRKPIISFIGPLEWDLKVEGVRRLVKAIPMVLKSYPSLILLIIGDGTLKDELQNEITKLRLNDNIIITGTVSDIRVPLKITDVYAHISLQETLGIAILEAMSMGKPVIATNIGGIPEIISNNSNGILVDPEPDNIAKAICDLINNADKLKKLAIASKETIQTKFDMNSMINNFMSLYKGEENNG